MSRNAPQQVEASSSKRQESAGENPLVGLLKAIPLPLPVVAGVGVVAVGAVAWAVTQSIFGGGGGYRGGKTIAHRGRDPAILPVDTIDILSSALHDSWVVARARSGCTRRQAGSPEVSYACLPEEDKQAVRCVLLQTLRAISGLGFSIRPPRMLDLIDLLLVPSDGKAAWAPVVKEGYTPMKFDDRKLFAADKALAQELAPALASNAHEAWVQARYSAGWRKGERLDGRARKEPLLAPFEELPPMEREAYARVARAVVEGLLAVGFELARPAPPS
eukprot:tig00021621_g22970.t1